MSEISAVRNKVNARTKKRLTFYVGILLLPLLQFAIFYIYVNFNSIRMAFLSYSENVGALGYTTKFSGIENFKVALSGIKENLYMVKNSLLLFFFQTVIGLPLALLFSFYVYKKFFMSGFFKVVLFLPQMISSIVFSMIFMYLASDKAVYTKLGLESGLFALNTDLAVRRATLLIYCVWMSFGVNVIMFTGAMSGINESVVESAQIDGANFMEEFFFVTVPMIFPTVTSFIIIGISGIFTHQMYLYDFYRYNGAELSTTGYFLYMQAKTSDLVTTDQEQLSYSVLSAYGLIITLVLFPLTMGVRKLLEKFGPNAN